MPDKIRLLLTISLAYAVLFGLYEGVRLKQEYEHINELNKQIDTLQQNISYSKERIKYLEGVTNLLNGKLLKTKKTLAALEKKQSVESIPSMKAVATAYGSSKKNGGNGSNKTATGLTPKEGVTIAVDPKKIPLGSKVYITCPTFPSIDGVYYAQDVGAKIKKNRVDIYMEDSKRKNMLKFGVRDVYIRIIEKPTRNLSL